MAVFPFRSRATSSVIVSYFSRLPFITASNFQSDLDYSLRKMVKWPKSCNFMVWIIKAKPFSQPWESRTALKLLAFCYIIVSAGGLGGKLAIQ